MENVKLNRAILHILDNNYEIPVLSARELDANGDIVIFWKNI